MDLFQRTKRLLSDEPLPAAFVDLDAFERNVRRHRQLVESQGLPLRVATKSVRVVALLRRIQQLGGPTFAGLMCYSAREAAFLADQGFDDLLIAYPPFRQPDLDRVAELTERGTIVSVAVDSREAIERLSTAGKVRGVRARVVLCIDMALKVLGAHLGVRRSPLRRTKDILALARLAESQPGTRFWGLLGYEAQVAGLGDMSPYEPHLDRVKRALKRVSMVDVGRRRRAIVKKLEAEGLTPTLVNGGGTGSLDRTTRATGVTEVAAGSGFLKPHLFDHFVAPHMQALEPAAFFALEVTRKPAPGWVTCLGGGYVASGTAGIDKVPLVVAPPGLALSPNEMAGEVQTPLQVPVDTKLELGDPVVFRHAKAGELAERFEQYLLVRDERIEERVPTYRGMGQCFF